MHAYAYINLLFTRHGSTETIKKMYNDGWEMDMGRYGYGERNERGERLLELAYKNDMYITNTRFQ